MTDETSEDQSDDLFPGWIKPQMHKARNWIRWFKKSGESLPEPKWGEPSAKFPAKAVFPNGGVLKLKRDMSNGEQWLLSYQRTMHGNGLSRQEMAVFLKVCADELLDMRDLLVRLPKEPETHD